MKQCQADYQDGNQCRNMVEGRTDFCAHHNREFRRQAENERKEAEKRAAKLNAPKPKQTAIRKVSEKQGDRLQIYNTRVKEWKVENPKCKANINEFCTKETEDNHHMRGKISEMLFNEEFWLPVCRSCHNYIGQHPLDALKRGLSFSRLAKDETI